MENWLWMASFPSAKSSRSLAICAAGRLVRQRHGRARRLPVVPLVLRRPIRPPPNRRPATVKKASATEARQDARPTCKAGAAVSRRRRIPSRPSSTTSRSRARTWRDECLLHYGAEVLESMVNRSVDPGELPAAQHRRSRDQQVDEEIDRMARKFSLPKDQWLQDAGKRARHQAGPLCQGHHLADAGPARVGQGPVDRHASKSWTTPTKASSARPSKCG